MLVKYTISVVDRDFCFQCSENESVLRGMERVGGHTIPVGCRSGGCGICRIEVLSGNYRTDRMSRACVTPEEESVGVALACRLFPESDLNVRLAGKAIGTVNRTERFEAKNTSLNECGSHR